MSKLSSFCFILFLCFVSGCTIDDSDTNPDIVPTIADEFNVFLWEHLSTDESTYSLIVETIADQECVNNFINNEVSFQSDNFIVNLNGIIQPEDCEEGTAPASADISFENLPVGTYDVEINILSLIKNEGFIEITPDAILLELTSNDGLNIINSNLNFVPNNTYWGYIALDKLQLNDVTSSFLEEIEIIRADAALEDGNYGHFKIAENQIDFETTSTFPDTDKFVFKFDGDVEDLMKLLDDYRTNENYVDQLEIQIMTYQGLSL